MISFVKEMYKTGTVKISGKSLTEVSSVPIKYTRIHTLYLSNNYISSLKNIDQFKNLVTLHVNSNKLEKISDIEPLKECRNLTNLTIDSNPVCELPLFNAHIIRLCPHLQTLNGRPISKCMKYSKQQLEGLLSLEENCFNSLFMSMIIKDALAFSASVKEIPPFVAVTIVNEPNGEEIKNRIRKECRNKSIANYYVYLRAEIQTIHSEINKLAHKANVDEKIVATHLKILINIGHVQNIEKYLSELQILTEVAQKLVEEDADITESMISPAIRCNEEEDMRADEKTYCDSEDSSYDEDRADMKSDNDLDDVASDEERLLVTGEGISEEITQSCQNTSDCYPTESERHFAVTFLKQNLANTSQSEIMLKNDQELSDASDFDQLKPVTIPSKSVNRDRIIAFSSEFFASRGESMDSTSIIQPRQQVAIESACSDFDKVEVRPIFRPRIPVLSRIRNSDFEASRGESMDMQDNMFNGNDSDSVSEFPQQTEFTFVENLSVYFAKWKRAFQNKSSVKSTASKEISNYCRMMDLKFKVKMQKEINKSMRKKFKAMVEKIQENKSTDMDQSRFKTQNTIGNSLSPQKFHAKTTMVKSSKKNSSMKKKK